MKRIRIAHTTEYRYSVPVKFTRHRALIRPREGHDVHITGSILQIEPRAEVRWIRDIYGNSIAVLDFMEMGDRLSIFSEVLVDLYDANPLAWSLDPAARTFPFHYPAEETLELVAYRTPSYAHDGAVLRDWLAGLHAPGQSTSTTELLDRLNSAIHQSFAYVPREESGVQTPCETLAKGSGSCRDYAVFMMEAVRHWGLGARFVTGYIQMADGQHGATHAWTEIYLPGAGWRGFDPTNNKQAGAEHVSVAVAREQQQAMPLSGAWEGPPDAFQGMNVIVQVTGT